MAFKKVALPQLTSAVKPGITPGLSASTKPGFKRVDLGYKISYAQAPTQMAPVKPVPVALRTAPASAGGGRGTINRGVVSLDSLITANQKTIKVPNIGFGNTPEADAAYRASVRSGVTKIEPERHTNLVKGIAAGTIGLKATPASIVAGVARGSEIGIGKIVKKEVPANGLFGNTPEYEAAYKNWTASTGGPTVTDKDRADYVKATNAAVTADQRMLRVVAIVDKEMQAKPNLYLPDRDKSGKVRKIDQFVYELGQGAVSEIAALTISAATGGAAAPIVAPLFGIWSFGSKYAEAVGTGVDTEKAYNSATISGLVNWIGEYVQLKMFGAGKNVLTSASDEVQGALNTALRDVALKSQPQVMARVAQLTAGLGKVGTAAGKIGIKNAAGGIVNDVIENAAQEFLESAGESAGDFASGVKPLNGQTFLDATAKAFKSAAYGGILAGATSIAIGNITMNVDRANLAKAQETIADAKSTLEAKLQTMNFEAKKISSALPIAAMGELQLGHGVVNTANMTASGFKTLLQTADNLAIFSVERSGQDEVLNNWGRTQEVSRIFGGVKAVLGIYEGEDGHIVHEHSFITTDVKSSMALAVAAGQESVLIKYQNAWYFVDPRTGEKLGTASGLNYAPIGAQTQVSLTGKKAMKFGFDNVQWGVEAEATPALVSAIDNKSEKEFADILSAAGLAYNEQGQAVYNSGPDTAMSGTTQQGTDATLGNVAAPPVMSGTTSQFLSKNILKALPALSEMAPHDIMRWAGITEEQIAGMSDKVVAGFAKRVETAYNVAKTKYGKNMAQVVSTMVKPYEQWGLEEYAGIREFSASILGEENVDLVTKILAATSAGMQVGANVTLTEKALRIILTEGRLPTGADGFLGAHIENMRKILAGIELPKVGEFAQAILGNEDALVIDRWMARFWFNAENPTNEQRLVAKVLTTQVAKKSGMTAREMQAAIWQYTREAAGEKAEGSFAKYGEMKAHADEIRFLQELLAKRNAVNQQSITDEAGNVNAITPFATDGAISPRAAAALKLDKSGYNAPPSATLFYQTQYGGQQWSGTGTPPTTMTITAGGNPVLTNQQGQPVAVLPTLLKTKPIQNFASQDSLSHAEELYKDDINVLRSLGYLDGYTYQLLSVIRGSSTSTEYAILHGLALLPDGMKQSFAPGVKLTPIMELGETLKKNGLTEENLNTFSILYAASKGNPVNLDSMPEVNLTKQGKGKLADKLAIVKANAITALAAYSPEQYALLKGVMDEAHKYLTPIVNAMHAKGMPLGENLDSGAINVDEWIDAYVSSAEPNTSGFDASSPTQEKHNETISHKQVTGYLNGIVNTMNRYNQWFQYNEYVKRFSTEMGYASDKAVKGAPTFFADNGDVKWVNAPDHIKRQITSIVSRAHATWGFVNTDIYRTLMTAERELKLMTPAFAQTNTVRDGALVLTRYGIHPVAMANTILKLIIGKSEKSSGLVGMGTPNELTGNVFSDFQNIDHAVALTHMQRLFQYVHDNILGASESLMRNYAYNVANASGKSEVEQMYALIASSADFSVYGSSETVANVRKAWQFSQASLDVAMSWNLAIKELGTKMASDNIGVKFEGFSAAALLIASIAAGIAFKAREKERKELQDYVSQNKIPIRIGSKIITIPEGFNTGAMLENTISTIVAGMINGDSVEEISGGLAQDVYGGLVGMIGRDSDPGIKSIASTLTPTLFEPITRVLLNVQYGGGEIDPMTWGLNWTHYFKSTTNVAKNLAQEMHDLSGGKLDISPIKMDYLVKAYLARYGTALTKLDSTGAKSAVSGFVAQQFVVPVPEGIKTQAYSDWQDGYAKIADDLAQAKKGNYPMSQLMVNDFQLLGAIDKLFPKQTTAQGVFALSLYGLTVLDAYAQHRKEKVQK